MNVIDLNNNSSKWQMKGTIVNADTRPRSELHLEARKIIRSVFPTMQLLEEVGIEPIKYKHLSLDFNIPLRKLAIEVQGQQHFNFNPFFHKSRADFINSKKNDRMKREWCEINNIALVALIYNEQDNWKNQLTPK